MKKFVNIICFLWMIVPCFAQNSYVELDTITYAGVKVIDQGKRQNTLTCLWQKGKNKVVTLTPYEVKSYATGGEIYVAKDIAINGKDGRFFIEKMVSGKLALYYIKNEGNHFFIEKDGVFAELTKRDASGKKHYKETLQALSADCDYTGSFLKHTWYNRFYLKRFVKRYNNCKEIYRPVRFGLVGGLDLTSYSIQRNAWDISNTPYESSFTFGAFIDIPLLQSRVSLHPEVFYSKQTYHTTTISIADKQEKEVIANIESYSVPLLIRYTWWNNKWSPYLNLGMVWYHYSRLENSLLTSTFRTGVLEIQKTELVLSPRKYSISGGGGVWYHISRRNAIFVDTRLTYNFDRMTYNILVGINF